MQFQRGLLTGWPIPDQSLLLLEAGGSPTGSTVPQKQRLLGSGVAPEEGRKGRGRAGPESRGLSTKEGFTKL